MKPFYSTTLALSLFITFNLNAAISNFCFVDEFGYIAEVTATRTAPGYYELNGTADVFAGYDWIVTGYYDKTSDVWSLTYTNPFPDGCLVFTDYFVYTSTSHTAGNINFDWTNYCFGGATDVGSASTIYFKSLCVFRLPESTPAGPASADKSLSGVKQFIAAPQEGTPLFRDLLFDQEFSVTTTAENNYTISFELDNTSDIKIDIYNYAGQYVTTVTEAAYKSGFYKLNWNGNDASGNKSKPGMYLAIMHSDAEQLTYKFIK